jgi:hypothetical protein
MTSTKPVFALATSGTNPKQTSTSLLNTEVNRVVDRLWPMSPDGPEGVLDEVNEARDRAEAAQDMAELYAPAYYKDPAAFFAASTVWPVGTRINARTGEVWDVVASGEDFLHPLNGIRLKLVPPAQGDVTQVQTGQSDFGTMGLAVFRASSASELLLSPQTYSGSADVPIATGDVISGVKGSTKVSFSTGDRLFTASAADQRANTLEAGSSNVQIRLQEQRAGLNTVTAFTGGQGALVSAGDLVTISGGIDPFDSDDALWEFSGVYRVREVMIDVIHLDGTIPVALREGYFFPGSAADIASAYADGTSYTAGDCALASDTGTASGTACWRCKTTHTASGPTLSADTGGNWTKLCNTQGTIAGTRDGRCVLEVWPESAVPNDIYLSGIHIENTRVTEVTSCLQIRGAYEVTADDIEVSGKTRIGINIDEGSRKVVLNRPKVHLKKGSSSFQRALSLYQGHAEVINADFIAGGVAGRSPVFIENYGRLKMRGGRLSSSDPSMHTNNWGFFATPGWVELEGVEVDGFDQPFRFNADMTDYDEFVLDSTPFRVTAKNCRFSMAGAGFRAGDPRLGSFVDIWPGNSFDIFDTGVPGEDNIQIENAELLRLTTTFAPLNSQTVATIYDFPSMIDGLPLRPAWGPAVLLGLEVFWANPAGADVIPRVFATQTDGTTTRAIASTSGSDAQVTVNTATPYAAKYQWNGTGKRVIGTGERLRYAYSSGAGVAAGGNVSICALLLKAGKKGL